MPADTGECGIECLFAETSDFTSFLGPGRAAKLRPLSGEVSLLLSLSLGMGVLGARFEFDLPDAPDLVSHPVL